MIEYEHGVLVKDIGRGKPQFLTGVLDILSA
jgi:hypothetical protein